MSDPVFGVLSREQLRELAAAPGFGSAAKVIRQKDPLWGRKDGEEIKWRVTFTRRITEVGHAYVMAASKDEADKLAANVDSSKISWGDDYRYPADWDEDIDDVVPAEAGQ